MGGFYQSKRDQKYQAELSQMFSDVQPPFEMQSESDDEFTMDPIGFEDMTESLCRDAEVLFSMTATQNRLSEAFMTTTGNLEKLIRRLGSCCLTKAALEAGGRTLPKLEGLDIRRLYCLGSFNFRKCHASISDGISRQQMFNISMLKMECSWFTTLQRLRSTEEKIAQIREGKISIDSLIRQDGFCKGDPSDQKDEDSSHSEFGKAAAFPIIRSALEETAAGAELRLGTSRKPKAPANTGGRIFRRMSPAQIRKEIEKKQKRKEAEAKARQEAEAEERSKEVVREAVSAVMAHKTGETPMEKFKAESQKSAAQKWAEIWEKNPPGGISPPASPPRQKPGKKKKKR